MISTYSTPLIVLEAVKKMNNGTATLEILAETTDQNSQSEVPITFVGKKAEGAAKDLIRGAKFTYRGYVLFSDGRPKLYGLSYTRIN